MSCCRNIAPIPKGTLFIYLMTCAHAIMHYDEHTKITPFPFNMQNSLGAGAPGTVGPGSQTASTVFYCSTASTPVSTSLGITNVSARMPVIA